jgi:hypothetical protein
MFNRIEIFIINIYRKIFFGESSEKKTEETKKCNVCLRRINISYLKCPYCQAKNYIFPFSDTG